MTVQTFNKIGVIGAGAWGTALAQVATLGGNKVILHAREPEVVASINGQHENSLYLGGVKLSADITATSDFADLAACDLMTKHDSQSRHLESLIADARALDDHSDFLAENLNFLLDASLGMITLEQNFVMKVFSVVAVVLMPPTLIAGIYGMNFKHMPELSWLYGYPMGLAIMLASAILPFWFARRRGWL